MSMWGRRGRAAHRVCMGLCPCALVSTPPAATSAAPWVAAAGPPAAHVTQDVAPKCKIRELSRARADGLAELSVGVGSTRGVKSPLYDEVGVRVAHQAQELV